MPRKPPVSGSPRASLAQHGGRCEVASGYNGPIMAANDKAKGMKSAYELALERMESQGIDRPSSTTLTDEVKRAISEARSFTQAKIAELEILHRDQMAKLADPTERMEQEEFYQRERESLTSAGEAKVEKIRSAAGA
jgi:hypothetical protein